MGLSGPARMPREIVDRLNREYTAALKRPEVIAALEKQAFMPNASSPEQFTAFQAQEFARWKKVIETGKITAD